MSEDRRLLWTVFVAAGAVIGLEIISFQALCVVNDYLAATQVIAVALLGLSLGGIAAWFIPDARRGVAVASALLPVTILASFLAIARLNPWPIPMLGVLATPYALTAILLSLVFRKLPPSRVYAWDLVGAATGAVVVVAGVPWLREEGGFLLLATLAVLPPALSASRRIYRLIPAIMAALLGVQIALSPINLLEIATADKALFGDKAFLYKNKEGGPLFEVYHSRGSLIERIDIVRRTDGTKRWVSVYNGRTVDVISGGKVEKGGLDNRLPTRLRWGQDPDTLLVGPSGQGLTKGVRMMGDGHIDAVELNGAIAHLMTNEMYERSGRAYDEMTLTIGDVRTFLARTDRRYDFITMLDTHRIYSERHYGPPEFIHTLEAMRSYLDHLKPDGLVLFEERTVDRVAELGFIRFLETMKAALRERGVEDPARHIVVWELWHHCSKAKVLSTPTRCNPKEQFTFLLVKASPYTVAEQNSLLEWQGMLDARQQGKDKYNGIVFRHLPDHPTEDRLSLAARAPEGQPSVDPAEADLSVITDDKPFPFDVLHDRGPLYELVERVVGLACAFVLLPAILVFRGRRDEPAAAGGRALGLALVPWYALVGVGYLGVEVLLMQRLAIWLASPTWSLAVVLPTMLCASGLAGALAPRLSKGAVLGAMAAVVAAVGLAALALPAVIDATMSLPWAGRVGLAVLGVGALAALMGLPFPWVTTVVQRRLGERYTGLFFAINGAAGAIVTPLTLLATMVYGFELSWLLAGGVYAASLLLLALAPTGGTAAGDAG